MRTQLITVWYIKDLEEPIISAYMFDRLGQPEGWNVTTYCPDMYIFFPKQWRQLDLNEKE